jgi:hypothetical protein
MFLAQYSIPPTLFLHQGTMIVGHNEDPRIGNAIVVDTLKAYLHQGNRG